MKNSAQAPRVMRLFVWPIFCCLGASLAANADILVLDKARSDVKFTCSAGLIPVRGQFRDVDGVVEFDEQAPERSGVKVNIRSASLTTGQPLLDQQLRGNNFFNVAAHPMIVFKSGTVKRTHSAQAEMTGELTLNGVTKPLTLRVVAQPPEKAAASIPNAVERNSPPARRFFLARGKIRRSDFGMSSLAFLVEDECEIQIHAALRRQD